MSISHIATVLDWRVLLMRAAGYVVCGLIGLAALIAPGWFLRGWYDGDEIANLQAEWSKQQMVEAQNFAMQLKDQNEQLEAMRRAEQEKEGKYAMRMDDAHRRELALRSSLRNRHERPAVPASGAATACQAGATGAELSRPDAEFLVGEAARADAIRAALERCQGGDELHLGRN